MNTLRIVRYAVWGAVVLLVIAVGLVFYFRESGEAPLLAGAIKGGPFNLVDQHGAPVTEAALQGHPSAMFFGYTNQLGTYAEAAGNPAGGDEDFLLLRLPGETQFSSPGTTLLPSQYYTINQATEYPRQAATFVNFLVNATAAGEIILTDRGVPSNPEVLEHITPMLSG